MHIVMIAARYLPFMGGIETHIDEVGRRMVRRGHRVTVLTTDPKGTLPAHEDVCGMQVIRKKAWPAERDYYFAPGIVRALLGLTPDIVHVQGYHTLTAPIGMLSARVKRSPYVVTFHSGGHSSAVRNACRGVQRAMLRPLIAGASHLIGVSKFEAQFFSASLSIPSSRFTVVPNGAELPSLQTTLPPPPSESRDRTILSVGRLERYKGHHRVIEAFPHLLRQHPDARLRIVGSGPYEPELRAAAARSGVSDRIAIGGIPPSQRDEMRRIMADASLVTLFSDYEAHPVAVLEALSLKRPVLVSDTSGFRELAEEGLVRAIPHGSAPQTLADAMAAQMTRPVRRSDVKLPTWDDCTTRLLDIYDRVIWNGSGHVDN